MASKHVTFAKLAEAEQYQQLCNKLDGGHPMRSTVQLKGGIHVTIALAPPGYGWSEHWELVIKHPDRKEWAHVAADTKSVGNPANVTPAEKVELDAKLATAQTLPADWKAEGTTATAAIIRSP